MSAEVVESTVEDNLLSAEEILGLDDVQYVDIEMPEWSKGGKPGVVRIKSLNAEELAVYTDAIEGPAKRNAMVLIIMKSAVKKDGSLLFSENQLGALRKKSVKAFSRLQDEILKINGLDKKAAELRKNV